MNPNFSADFLSRWNTKYPLTLNRRTNQLLDQAAVQRAEAEGIRPDELEELCDWLGESGQITRYPRPAQWFNCNANGVRIIDQIRLEMAHPRPVKESVADRLARLKRERLAREGAAHASV